jgi:hypothetical protein
LASRSKPARCLGHPRTHRPHSRLKRCAPTHPSRS